VRQSEGLSVARGQGMTRTDVSNCLKILQKIVVENDLLKKSQNISNMDGTGSNVKRSQRTL
jgi:hypothetical protein